MQDPSHIIMADGTLVTKDGIEYVPKQAATKDTTDGHHTFKELYYYRMLYNAQAATAWTLAGIPVVKSWKHHDGELCFGGGMFVVQAELPTGQVSNHYKEHFWDLFNVPAVELPPEYDGHTPEDAASRMYLYLLEASSTKLF